MLTLLKYLVVILALGAIAIVAARVIFALPQNSTSPSTALPPASQGPLAGGLDDLVAAHPGKTGIAALRSGSDAFAARMILAEAATTSIDAQYYIWHGDLTGAMLLDALRRAADRGVRVRLLLDDNGTSGLDPELAQLDAHPNAEVRLYNPFNLRQAKLLAYTFDFFRLNRRMHNKSFIVDGRVAVMGGRNVGDEYFGTGEAALYVDLDVLAAGEIVPRVSEDFDRYWNAPSVHAAAAIIGSAPDGDAISTLLDPHLGTEQMASYRQILEQSDIVDALMRGTLDLEWTDAVLISDDPIKGEGRARRRDLLATRLRDAVGGVSARFDGVSPYFVPGAPGVRGFGELEASGANVRLLTNSLEATDVLPVHAGYAKRRRDLLEAGVRLFELRRTPQAENMADQLGPFGSSGASLHAKTFAVDSARIFVGSFNFDPRSVALNTEMGLLIDSPTLAGWLHDGFERGLDGRAWEVQLQDGDLIWIDPRNPDAEPLTNEPGSTPFRRAALIVIGWLPVEWLL